MFQLFQRSGFYKVGILISIWWNYFYRLFFGIFEMFCWFDYFWNVPFLLLAYSKVFLNIYIYMYFRVTFVFFYIKSQKGWFWPQRTSTSIVTLIVKSVYFGHNNRKTIKEDELKYTALLCRTIYTLYKNDKKYVNPIQSPSWEYINSISLENNFLTEQVSLTYTV